jgi:hypothetical protein
MYLNQENMLYDSGLNYFSDNHIHQNYIKAIVEVTVSDMKEYILIIFRNIYAYV